MNTNHTLDTLIPAEGFSLVHRIRSATQLPPAGQATPALFLLHGVGANEAGLAELARRQDPRLAVFLLRAPLTFGPGQFGWFQVQFGPQGPVIRADQAEASRQTLLRFIDEAVAAHGLDPQRLWMAGFSQGGILSASVGLTRPDKVAGFGVLSGRILPEITPQIAPREALKQTQAFVSHGTHDSKLTIEWAHKARALLEAHGVSLSYHEYPGVDHALTHEMVADFDTWLKAGLARTAA
jgi:phospholipase/carboxylesterase